MMTTPFSFKTNLIIFFEYYFDNIYRLHLFIRCNGYICRCYFESSVCYAEHAFNWNFVISNDRGGTKLLMLDFLQNNES